MRVQLVNVQRIHDVEDSAVFFRVTLDERFEGGATDRCSIDIRGTRSEQLALEIASKLCLDAVPDEK